MDEARKSLAQVGSEEEERSSAVAEKDETVGVKKYLIDGAFWEQEVLKIS